jgi:SSS family transporter
MRISSFDLLIIVLYLIGITLFGMRFRKGQQDIRDYFLGGRTAPWWAITFSIVATETSLLTVIGTPAIAFGGNLGFLQLVFGYIVGRILICFLFIPQYFSGEFYTAYQLIEKRFGANMKSVAASTFLVTRALAEGVRVAAIAKVVSVAFGIEAQYSVIPIAALTLIYTFEGGMKAVIWTDAIQMAIYLTGGVLALFLVVGEIPGGWNQVVAVAAAAPGGDKLSIFNFAFNLTTTYTFWSGLFGGVFLTLASHGTDQLMVQRYLAARNEGDAKKALVTSGFVVFFQFALFLVLGVCLYVYNQQQAVPLLAAGGDNDRVFPEFVVREMPPGIAGLLIAAIFAAGMSNLSGALNSLASSTIIDFNKIRGMATDPEKLVRLSRWTTVAWGLILMGLGVIKWGGVLEKGLTVASIIYQSLLGLFLLGILNKRATTRGALVGMAAGLVLMLELAFGPDLVRYGVPQLFPKVPFTWYVLLGSTVTFLIGSVASLLGSPSQKPAS